jgi:hypothetical protein
LVLIKHMAAGNRIVSGVILVSKFAWRLGFAVLSVANHLQGGGC